MLGTELYNPVIRNFFLKTSFKNLPLALELAVESLPLFIANIPDFKTLIKNPVSIFYQVISQADRRLSEIKEKTGSVQKIFIVSGSVGEGKTTFIKNLINLFSGNNIKIGGIFSERVISDSLVTGYDVVNIETGEKEVFLRQNEDCGSEKIGRFTICQKGLAMGNSVLHSQVSCKDTIVVIDEVGMLELRNKGWADSLDGLVRLSGNHLLIGVRDIYLESVIKRWNFAGANIFYVSKTDYSDAFLSIKVHLDLHSTIVHGF